MRVGMTGSYELADLTEFFDSVEVDIKSDLSTRNPYGESYLRFVDASVFARPFSSSTTTLLRVRVLLLH